MLTIMDYDSTKLWLFQLATRKLVTINTNIAGGAPAPPP